MIPTVDFLFIDNTSGLEQFCENASRFPALGIDTEFIREKTYYPQLCLVQISIPDSVAIIDPLCIDDLSALKTLLLNPAITKIFHAGRQDQEIFFYLWGELPAPVFDTQLAASMLGIGDQVGYGKLISSEFGQDLDKTQSRTDWAKRPLSEKQLHYAADDVRYLIPLYERQLASLTEQQRMDWISSDFEALSDPTVYTPNLETLWQKVKGLQKLRGAEFAILKELCAWREIEAREKDRPRRHVLSDDALLDLARTKPKSEADMSRLRSLTPGQAQKFGAILLEKVQTGLNTDKANWPKLDKRKPLSIEEDAIIDILSAMLKLLAEDYAIHPTRVASRQDLQQLLHRESDAELMHGWKHKHFGQAMLHLLNGERQIQIRENRITLIDK